MTLEPTQKSRLEELVQVFLEENSNINLSALRTVDQCWNGNVLDSLSFIDLIGESRPRLELPANAHVADIGTGGGFPLLPLAMLLPQHQFTGIDATKKKVDAVGRIAQKLGLTNIHLVSQRLETLGHHPSYRDQFDVVTARAVAPVSILLEYSLPLLKEGGYAVFWKSTKVSEEQRDANSAAELLYAKKVPFFDYTLPGDWGERRLLLYKKVGTTPPEYPRGIGEPTARPL